MNFPRIVKEDTIVLPEIKTFEAVVDAEYAYETLINSTTKLYRQSEKDIHVYYEYMKPWFLSLYNREEVDKVLIIELYGKFLRNSIINHLKNGFISKEYLKSSNSFLSKIKLFLRIILLSFSQAGNDAILIKFGKLMGPESEKKIRFILSKESKLDGPSNNI